MVFLVSGMGTSTMRHQLHSYHHPNLVVRLQSVHDWNEFFRETLWSFVNWTIDKTDSSDWKWFPEVSNSIESGKSTVFLGIIEFGFLNFYFGSTWCDRNWDVDWNFFSTRKNFFPGHVSFHSTSFSIWVFNEWKIKWNGKYSFSGWGKSFSRTEYSSWNIFQIFVGKHSGTKIFYDDNRKAQQLHFAEMHSDNFPQSHYNWIVKNSSFNDLIFPEAVGL